MRTCKKCNLTLDETRFYKTRTTCKKCRSKSKKNNIRRRMLDGTMDLNLRITFWLRRTILKPRRKHLPREEIRKLAIDGLKKFPYMEFCPQKDNSCKEKHSHQMKSASLDRIDPKLGYELGNLQVIPMWLNEAKYQGDINDLIPHMRDFVENFESFKEYIKSCQSF